MKYVIYNGHAWTPKQLNKNPIRPIIEVKPYHKHDIEEGESSKDEGESSTSTELSQDSISDIPTGSSEDSILIEASQVPTDLTHPDVINIHLKTNL